MSSIVIVGLVWLVMVNSVVVSQNYNEALSKSILFYEGQRSGKLPTNQRMSWRKDSGLSDGSDISMDLTGGYYDAGDNVKFNFPMAFTTTVLSWSILEFGYNMGPELGNAQEAVRWGSDYFLKATARPGMVVAQVGDPIKDHNCWERPEDMDTLRTTYVVNQTNPGSEVAGETAAALAAASMVFRGVDDAYSKTLLDRAYQVFDFADKYQGSYNISVGSGVCPFYCDFNGYKDELVWAAVWLYKASGTQSYLQYAMDHLSDAIGFDFGWDSKHSGIQILASAIAPQGNPFVSNADQFVCSVLPDLPTTSCKYSKGGLLLNNYGSNLQQTTGFSFLLTVYAGYMKKAGRNVQCGNVAVTADRLIEVAKSQVDYILGKNPLGMSYMVGYSNKYPQRIHHRGSTLPSVAEHPQPIGCHEGTPYFESTNPNPNVLVGAVVGGPDSDDQYGDTRLVVSQSEPTTYLNSATVGVLAYFRT